VLTATLMSNVFSQLDVYTLFAPRPSGYHIDDSWPIDMDAATASLDLSLAPLDIITVVMQTMCDKDRLTCALVCRAWAKAAAAATTVIRVLQPSLQTFNCVQQWLEKHGQHLVILHLYGCGGAALTALPCAQLQDLVLDGDFQGDRYINVSSRVWDDIAAATKLTSVSM